MPNKTVPPACAPTDAEDRETERKLFEGLAGVKTFPMDPSGPGQPPGQMLPVQSANQPKGRSNWVGNTRKPVSRMDPQARHDQALRVPKPDKVADSATLEDSLKKNNGPSMEPPLPSKSNPGTEANNFYARAHDTVIMLRLMRNNPGLVFEDVEKMAMAAGLLGHDPIAQAMINHPGLTRENAEEMARAFGF